MSLLMLLAMGGFKKPKTVITKTFTANGTITFPAGVLTVDKISGHGGAGSPASSSGRNYDEKFTWTAQRRDFSGYDVVVSWSYGTPGVAPAAYCDPQQLLPDSTVYTAFQRCYSFVQHQSTNYPATTGTAATALGKIFPGGLGGPTTIDTASFTDIPVTPGAAYAVKVPTGGSVTITYSV